MPLQAFTWNLWPQIKKQYTTNQTKTRQRGPVCYAGRKGKDTERYQRSYTGEMSRSFCHLGITCLRQYRLLIPQKRYVDQYEYRGVDKDRSSCKLRRRYPGGRGGYE